jgi:putative transposase
MTRPLRLELPGGIYHVTSRGNNRGAIVRDDDDRLSWRALLDHVCDRYGWITYAWCLMTNHHHIVIETPLPNLALGMRQLNGRHAQRFNRRHSRSGHVFQARYDAQLVQDDAHLHEAIRYVLLNPVRAGICRHPVEYPWGSYHATVGKTPAPPHLDRRRVLAPFQLDPDPLAAFDRFLLEPFSEPPQPLGGLYHGDRAFAAIHAPNQPIPEIPRRHWQPVRPELHAILDGADKGMLAAYRIYGYTLGQIAAALGKHPSTISRRLRALECKT